MNKTKIEWTEYSWNPVSGCTPISEGCQNCYAKRMANRLRGRCGYPADEPFKVTLHKDRLEEPLRWKKPRRVFVCSMGDLFHENVPFEYIAKVWQTMNNAEQHTFLVLTKRPKRMVEFLSLLAWYNHDREVEPAEAVLGTGGKYTLPNVWLGVTAENQQRADERIPILMQIPAAVRFVSVEPMLGSVDVSYYLSYCGSCNAPINKKDPSWRWNGICWEHKCPSNHPQLGYFAAYTGVDWVICGGETGPGARPMHPDWVQSLRDQCRDARVPFFFKQWGEYCSPSQMPPDTFRDWDIQHGTEIWDDEPRWRVGKKKAGRLLDGWEWNEKPVKPLTN